VSRWHRWAHLRLHRVVAALDPIAPDDTKTAAHRSVTFAVDDADATTAKARELGGEIVVRPVDAPWTRMAVMKDPQGGTFIASQFIPETSTSWPRRFPSWHSSVKRSAHERVRPEALPPVSERAFGGVRGRSVRCTPWDTLGALHREQTAARRTSSLSREQGGNQGVGDPSAIPRGRPGSYP
jgi:hypothetical protein